MDYWWSQAMSRIVIPKGTSLEHYSKTQFQMIRRNDLHSSNKEEWDSNLIEFHIPNQHTKIFNVKAKFYLKCKTAKCWFKKVLYQFFDKKDKSTLLVPSCVI